MSAPRSLSDATLAFIASETTLCGELGIAARFSAASSVPLMISSSNTAAAVAALRAGRFMPSSLIGDARLWRGKVATSEVPTELQEGMRLYDLDEWARSYMRGMQADAVLTPSYFVTRGDWASLEAVLEASLAPATPDVVTLIPTDAAMLESSYLSDLLRVLHNTSRRQLAFVFAANKRPLAKRDRLGGLRDLLREFPGSWILGVDVLVATDALAHGAGLVGVGASSGYRWPQRPGDSGGPLARNFLPGLFLRELLEFRSPDFYADWFADSPSPSCELCARTLDAFEPTAEDKQCIIQHNLHAIQEIVTALLSVPAIDRIAWIRDVRLAALEAHASLTSQATPVQADSTLRFLCEMDDPHIRETARCGAWIEAKPHRRAPENATLQPSIGAD